MAAGRGIGGGDQVARALEELEALAREVRGETGLRFISDVELGHDDRPLAAVAGLRALAGDREGGVARLRELVEKKREEVAKLNPLGWTMLGDWPSFEDQVQFQVLASLELCREFAVHGPARLVVPVVEELTREWEDNGDGGSLDDSLVGGIHDTCCRLAAEVFRAAGREPRADEMEEWMTPGRARLVAAYHRKENDRDPGEESAAERFAAEVETFREWLRARHALRVRRFVEAGEDETSLLSCARLAAEVTGDDAIIAGVRRVEEAGGALAAGVSVPEPLPAPVPPAPPLAREDVKFPSDEEPSEEPDDDEEEPPALPDPEKVRELVEGLGQEKAGIDRLREAARAALALIGAGEDDAVRELLGAIRRFLEMAPRAWSREERLEALAGEWVGRRNRRWETRPGSVAREALELLLATAESVVATGDDGTADLALAVTARVRELLGEKGRAEEILRQLRQRTGLLGEDGDELDDVDGETVLERLLPLMETAARVGLPEGEVRWYVERAGRLASEVLEYWSGSDIDPLRGVAGLMWPVVERAVALGMEEEALEYASAISLWRDHFDWLETRAFAWWGLDLETRARLVACIWEPLRAEEVMDDLNDPVPPGLYRSLRDREMAFVVTTALREGGAPLATWLLQEYGSSIGYTSEGLSLWLDVAEVWLYGKEPGRAAALMDEAWKRFAGYGERETAARVLSLCAALGDRERLLEGLRRAGTMAGDLPTPGDLGRQVVETGLRLAREPEYADRAAEVILDLLEWHDDPAAIAETLLRLAAAFERAGREPGPGVVERLWKVVVHLEDLSAA